MTEQTSVWTVAQIKDHETGEWELGGVFSSPERAAAACTHRDDCYWETILDHAYPRETIEAPSYVPRR